GELLMGDVQVLLESGLELRARRRLDHPRERLDDLALGAVKIPQLLHIELLQVVNFHDGPPGRRGLVASGQDDKQGGCHSYMSWTFPLESRDRSANASIDTIVCKNVRR